MAAKGWLQSGTGTGGFGTAAQVPGAWHAYDQIAQLFDPPKVNEEDINRMLRTSVISTPSAPKCRRARHRSG